jgi:hypothetical protein
MLQGFFNAEVGLYDLLRNYYLDAFGTELIGFPKDYLSYAQQVEILKTWAARLQFGGGTLSDEVAAIDEEVRGS